ncbi:THO complex subunit 4B-like protein [Drosera capensis]
MLVALAHRLGMGLHRSDMSLLRLFFVNRSIRSRRSSGRGRVRGAAPEGWVVRGSFGSGRIGRMGALRQRNLGVNSRPSAASIAKARLNFKGSTEVVYARRSDAFAAFKRYNNVQLDGWPMKIEILSPNSEAPLSTLPVLTLSEA